MKILISKTKKYFETNYTKQTFQETDRHNGMQLIKPSRIQILLSLALFFKKQACPHARARPHTHTHTHTHTHKIML